MLASILLASFAAALPNPLPQSTTGNGATSPIGSINTTTITFYQGVTTAFNTTCGSKAVETGNLTAGYCRTLYTYAAGVASIPDVDCVFALYKGSDKCMAGEGVNVTYVPVPRGNGSACVVDGVLDGGIGAWTTASGVWVCG